MGADRSPDPEADPIVIIMARILRLKQQHAAVRVDKAPEGVCVHFQMADFCV